MNSLEACEMWCLCRMGRISYKDRKTNEEVLALFGINKKLIVPCIHKCPFLTTSRDMTQNKSQKEKRTAKEAEADQEHHGQTT